MKKLFACFLALALSAIAHAAVFTATFQAGGATFDEFAVEERKTATSWVEVAKGPASPIQWTVATLAPGTYTFRVYARSKATPTNRSPNSDEVTVVVSADRPTDLKITVVTVVTVIGGTAPVPPSP